MSRILWVRLVIVAAFLTACSTVKVSQPTATLTPQGTLSLPWAKFFQQLFAAANTAEDAALLAAFEPASSPAASGLTINRCTQAALPTLGAGDAGYMAWVTDYQHLLFWNGTAWQWGPGENGSGYIQFFAVAPAFGTGWALVDGSAITYLTSTGTTDTVTPGSMIDGRYVRGGAAFSGAQNAATAAATGAGAIGEPQNMDWLPYFRT